MAITEKTVELNVSRTVVEKMRRTHRINAYAIGASQAQEAQFGFDVLMTDGSWCGGYIQYKRLYANGSIHRWNLNRTKHKDQHSLLLQLEASGFPVFYCFPKFDSEVTLRRWTPPSLWSQVWWVRPSSIQVPSPVDAHHHVTHNPATGQWQVFSDVGKEFTPEPADFLGVETQLLELNIETHSLARLKEVTRKLLDARWSAIANLSDASKDDSRARARYASNVMRETGLIAFQTQEARLRETARASQPTTVRNKNRQGSR
ncbi:hypothetical protein [Ralstonia pseudosolanacearum]|uniref:hypothetical protein n=1 Tax=Ralstonia pseudosolanacearum TaxID=1310165 RepID=UPI003AACD45B